MGVASYGVALLYLLMNNDLEGYLELLQFSIYVTVITFIFTYIADYLRQNE